MAQREEITYTIAAMDRTGKIPMVFLKPNYSNPAIAFEVLKGLRNENRTGIFKVLEASTRILDDQELQKLVDSQEEKA